MTGFDVTYFLNVGFTAIAFFTFIKLLSNDVYLNYHRILPSIGAIIMIHDFYVIIMPVAGTIGATALLRTLCDMCSIVIIFVMFSYMLLVKKPRFYLAVHIITITAMVGLCAWKLHYLILGIKYDMTAEIIGLVCVVVGSIYTLLAQNPTKTFVRQDKRITAIMYVAFVIALVGYSLQAVYHDLYIFVTAAFGFNCICYYYMAATNQIEDLAVTMAGTIFDSINVPMIIVDNHYYVADINEACRKAFPNRKDVAMAFENGDYHSKFLLGKSMIKSGENDKEIFSDGKWYQINWTKVEVKKGVRGYIFSCADVTDQHQEIENANVKTAEKSQFLAHMSHELRSPLHAIIGVSDILLEKHDISTKNRNLIQHIKKASDGLLDFVDAILDFSKLEAGKFTFAEKKYCTQELYEELSYNTIVNLQSKPVDFALAVTTDYPKYLYGDALRVREVIQNLLSNAAKFTESGSIRAELAFEQVEDKYKISFKVQDTGCGMTPAQIDEVFAEYVSNNNGNEGTGLGLTIAKQLVELLGGTIHASSDGKTGSTFYGEFYQKAVESELLPEQIFNRRTIMHASSTPNSQNLRVENVYPNARVLVADDMKINLEIMKQILQPWKVNVTCVSDGLQAVNAVKESEYDLIMLDQMMAPMEGPEAAEIIRTMTDTPIVLVSANTEDNVQAILEECHINDYISKPIHIQRVAHVLEEYLPEHLKEKNLDESVVVPMIRRDMTNVKVYRKTLETFVKEMQPLLLHLAEYSKTDRDMFKVKVHGIKGVSNQIGRDSFAEKAEIMEMAAKSEHWPYVEKHLDDFLTALCETVEEVTNELTQLVPDDGNDTDDAVTEKKKMPIEPEKLQEIFKDLFKAFEEFDVVAIEAGINSLEVLALDDEQTAVFEKLSEAYDTLDYEIGSEVLSNYLNK